MDEAPARTKRTKKKPVVVELDPHDICGLNSPRWGRPLFARVYLMDPIPPPEAPWRRENPNPTCALCGGEDDGTIRPAGRFRGRTDDRLMHIACWQHREQ